MFERFIAAVALALAFSLPASAACIQTAGYPWAQNSCINPGDINNAFDLSISPAPPSNAYGQGAQQGKEWLDTSTSPATLRLCGPTTGCGTVFTASQWITLGFADFTNSGPIWPIGGGVATIIGGSITDLSKTPANFVTISGSATITALGTLPPGQMKFIGFSGASTLVNSPSLQLPGGTNYTTAPGIILLAVSLGGGNWQITNAGGGTIYTAGAGLALSLGNQFSIANGGVTTAMLAVGVAAGNLGFAPQQPVATMAALHAMPTTTLPAGTLVALQGYYTAGDFGAPLPYASSPSTCPLNSGTGDAGSEEQSSDGGCWLAQFSNFIDARQFGVRVSGDSTTAAQNAVNAALAFNLPLYFPTGFNFTQLAVPNRVPLVRGGGDNNLWTRTAVGPGIYQLYTPGGAYPSPGYLWGANFKDISISSALPGWNFTLDEAMGADSSGIHSFSTLLGAAVTAQIGATATANSSGSTSLTLTGINGTIHAGSALTALLTGSGVPVNTFIVSGSGASWVTNQATTLSGVAVTILSDQLDVASTDIGTLVAGPRGGSSSSATDGGMMIVCAKCGDGQNSYPVLTSGTTLDRTIYAPTEEMIGSVSWQWPFVTFGAPYNNTFYSAAIELLGNAADITMQNIYAGTGTYTSAGTCNTTAESAIGIAFDTVAQDGSDRPNHGSFRDVFTDCSLLGIAGLNASDETFINTRHYKNAIAYLFGSGAASGGGFRNIPVGPYLDGTQRVALQLGPRSLNNLFIGGGDGGHGSALLPTMVQDFSTSGGNCFEDLGALGATAGYRPKWCDSGDYVTGNTAWSGIPDTATGSWTTSSTTIATTLAAPPSTANVIGYSVIDQTPVPSKKIGTVKSWSGNTLTLTAAAAFASSGASDALYIEPAISIPAGTRGAQYGFFDGQSITGSGFACPIAGSQGMVHNLLVSDGFASPAPGALYTPLDGSASQLVYCDASGALRYQTSESANVSYTPTIICGTGSVGSYSKQTGKFRQQMFPSAGISAWVSAAVTAAAGSCSGTISIALPAGLTSADVETLTAFDATAKTPLGVSLVASGTSAQLFTPAGGNPTPGDAFVLQGTFY